MLRDANASTHKFERDKALANSGRYSTKVALVGKIDITSSTIVTQKGFDYDHTYSIVWKLESPCMDEYI